MKIFINIIVLLVFTTTICAQSVKSQQVITGAAQTNIYLPMLQGKNVALVANQTSTVGNQHLVDTLLKLGIKIKKVFSPEHGFRGTADAGEHIKNYKDKKTGLPIVALYGNNYKPKPADLKDIDVVIFDIQDVGARFYTYISTMHYVMEACAESKKQFMVLDRPNPNGHYVDGPVLKLEQKSFVGMHPIPIVHGLTVGELAQMINGEQWLTNKITCNLTVIPCANYNHQTAYELPVKPSPNLASMEAIYLYPSLCLFEGTPVSVGRGTTKAFEVYGHPQFKKYNYKFTPKSIAGASKNPPYENEVCKGFDLKSFADNYITSYKKIYLFWLIDAYKQYPDKATFFNSFFSRLAGNTELQAQIIKGLDEDEIRKTWEPALSNYKEMRKKYLLYDDFEN